MYDNVNAKEPTFALIKRPEPISFTEDDFDIEAHKNAATTSALTKAKVKRDRRITSVGKIIIGIAAFAVCALLWLMLSTITGLF